MRTQKAKGIAALQANHKELTFNGSVKLLPFQLIAEERELQSVDWTAWQFPVFARPCPIFPRHGFVDSRPINNPEEAIELFREARGADEMAEMVLMPYVRASHNAIWTPGVLTVGPGNDGATAGRDSVSIKTTSKLPISGSELLAASGMKAGDVAYMEFVKQEESPWYAVQLRGGPNIADLGDDYLPCETECKRIVLAEGDLLEWESTVKTLEEGTVVYHPGGSLSSHYGVHSKLNKVPIFCKRKPEIGVTYKLCPCKPAPKGVEWCSTCDGFTSIVPQLDVDEVLKGFSQGIALDIPFERNVNHPEGDGLAVKLLLGALHNVSFFGKKESRLLGVGIALTIRLALCACFGEVRHKSNPQGLARDQIYKQAWKDVADYVKRFNEARKKFYEKGWRPHFGGKAWAECANVTAELWNLTVKFVRSKSPEALTRVVEAFNKIVNCAHNTGPFFNKFVDPEWFNVAVNYPAAPLIAVGDIIHRILKEDVRIEGLVAEIESASGEAGAKPAPQPQVYGGFSIVYTADLSKPWNSHTHNLAIHFSDGTSKHCSSVLGIARAYLNKIGEEATKRRIREVRDEIIAIIGTPDQYGSEDHTWLIPNLSKHDLVSLGQTVKTAQGIFRGTTFHIQTTSGAEGEHYSNIDKAMGLMNVARVQQWFKSAPKALSKAGGDKVYAVLDVRADGIYAGPLKIVVLKNFKEVL